MEKVGLIAGNGRLPYIFLQRARERGIAVFTLAVRKEAGRSLAGLSAASCFIPLGSFERGVEFFKSHGVGRVVMLGQVLHHRLLGGDAGWDETLRGLFAGLPDRRAATLLNAVIGSFERHGLDFLPSSYLLEDHFLPPGTHHGPPLSKEETASLALGRRVAETLSGLDVGLTVAVGKGIVLALEAIEGTNLTIRRAGRFTRGIVVVKVCRPVQDQRFDLPVIGPVTLKTMARVSGRVLAFSAGTLLVDKERVLAEASRRNISLSVF